MMALLVWEQPGLLQAPWGDSAFVYVGGLLASLLAATAVMLGIVTARGRGGAAPRTLWARWLTWAVLAPLFALIVFSGVLPVALLLGLFALQGTREWGNLAGLPRAHRTVLALSSVVALSLAVLGGAAALLATIPLLLLAAMLQPVIAADTERGMRDLAFGALGFAYLPLLLSFGVLLVRDVPNGAALLFTAGAAAAASDIGAYIVGKSIGSKPLAPTLSPNKTVEGLLGNVAGALLAVFVLWPILPGATPLGLFLLATIVALGAVWGDLFASALKREAGAKDAGRLLPGFGGLLDRIDSFIVAVPLVYYLARLADLVGIGVTP
ncbi:MAG: phosphatidate cytidylyltransferase [Chloroflexota bacterium]